MIENTKPTQRCGSVFIDLLVTLSVLALLAALLGPAARLAHVDGQNRICVANLHEIGHAFSKYVVENSRRVPDCPAAASVAPDRPSLPDVLAPSLSTPEVFRCPGDEYGYFGREHSSYEYPLAVASLESDRKIENKAWFRETGEGSVVVLREFLSFHPGDDDPDARNHLYYDGHIGRE